MGRKPKFRPEIRRVKLNPEQAVLACSCYIAGMIFTTAHRNNHAISLNEGCLSGRNIEYRWQLCDSATGYYDAYAWNPSAAIS